MSSRTGRPGPRPVRPQTNFKAMCWWVVPAAGDYRNQRRNILQTEYWAFANDLLHKRNKHVVAWLKLCVLKGREFSVYGTGEITKDNDNR